jgi:hypothetical protein
MARSSRSRALELLFFSGQVTLRSLGENLRNLETLEYEFSSVPPWLEAAALCWLGEISFQKREEKM